MSPPTMHLSISKSSYFLRSAIVVAMNVTTIFCIEAIHYADQVQAIEFRVGFNSSSQVEAGSAAVRGQSFRLDKQGSYGPANTQAAVLKSIRFLYNSNVTPAVGTTVLIYSSVPSPLDLSSGTGALLESSPYSTVVDVNDTTTTAADGFVGSGFSTPTNAPISTTRKSVLFQFTSPTVLNASTTYYALFRTGQALVRGSTAGYADGSSYVEQASPNLLIAQSDDRLFMVTADSIPFEFETVGGVMILGAGIALHRLRKLKK
ncbi:MAG: hypothetical protein NW214_15065 [Pseudanabaenaceae cyanobacterium bins.39]|nr:hypothetical protein [Pseudanabaenaceae cyanobacterium bins.39]